MHLLDSGEDDSSYDASTNESDNSFSSVSSAGDGGNAEEAGRGRYPGRVGNAPVLYGEEFPGTRLGTLRSNRPMSFAISVMPYISAIRELMVREARREAEAKGNTLPEVTMSTVKKMGETRNEFTYANYLEGTVGADMPSTVYSDILPKVAHTVMTQLALKKGLKEFRDRGKESVSSKLLQIHMQDTLAPAYGGARMSEE